MYKSYGYVSVEGGTPVWDSYGDWLDMVRDFGGYILQIEAYEGTVNVYAQKTPWTDEQVAEKVEEVRKDNEMSESKELFSFYADTEERS